MSTDHVHLMVDFIVSFHFLRVYHVSDAFSMVETGGVGSRAPCAT